MIDESLFSELYKLLRGSSAAPALIEAQNFYNEERFEDSLAVLEKMFESYSSSRQSTINKDLSEAKVTPRAELDKETKRLVRKQDKANDAIGLAGELIDLVRREVRKKNVSTRATSLSGDRPPLQQAPVMTSGSIVNPAEETEKKQGLPQEKGFSANRSLEDAFKSLRELLADIEDLDERQKQIDKYFDKRLIRSEKELHVDDVLQAISGGTQHILVVEKINLDQSLLGVRSALTGTHMKPIAFENLRLSISKSKLFRLELRSWRGEEASVGDVPPIANASESDAPDSESDQASEVKLTASERDQILDMGAFSQLVDSAQRSGIVPGISIIVQVRDCEYRLGKYHLALQLMETQFSILIGNAMQRTQRLKREEQDIASGRLKLSPRELLAKRARDNQETEAIERARMKFTRVIEGLRGLMHAVRMKIASTHTSAVEE